MEYELLRSCIITLALFNSFVIGRRENNSTASGKRRYFASICVGVSASSVFLVSTLCTRLCGEYLPQGLLSDAAGVLAFVFVAVLASFALGGICSRFGFGGYGKTVMTDSTFLGAMLAFSSGSTGEISFARVLVVVAYFLPSLLLFSRIRARLDESESTSCFAGFPIMLLAGGFLSLALSGIAGIVQSVFA